MNALQRAKTFLLSREGQRGQTLVILLFVLTTVLVLVGFAIDMGLWWHKTSIANESARAGCVAAANSAWLGGNAQTTFTSVMTQNGIPTVAYSPKQGTGLGLKAGLELETDGSWRAALSWQEPTYFLNLVGVTRMPVFGKARCLDRNTGGSPIAVRKSALDYSTAHPGAAYTILGRDPKWKLADVESGTNFRGAVYVHMWCIPSSDPNCPNQQVFWPLTSAPPSPAEEKQLADDCFAGINCNITPPIGSRLPIVSGTSDAMLCKSFQSVHNVGDKILVVVFNGTVESPDPTYGNWENVRVIYYAVYQVVSFEPNAKNCNHMVASLVGGPYSSLDQVPPDILLLSREISWDYTGVLP